jgi:hypothetical protein
VKPFNLCKLTVLLRAVQHEIVFYVVLPCCAAASKHSELCIISLTGLVINWRRGLKRWQIAPFKRTMHFLFNYPLSFKSAASIIHGLWATKRAALFDFSAFAGLGLAAAFLFLF